MCYCIIYTCNICITVLYTPVTYVLLYYILLHIGNVPHSITYHMTQVLQLVLHTHVMLSSVIPFLLIKDLYVDDSAVSSHTVGGGHEWQQLAVTVTRKLQLSQVVNEEVYLHEPWLQTILYHSETENRTLDQELSSLTETENSSILESCLHLYRKFNRNSNSWWRDSVLQSH